MPDDVESRFARNIVPKYFVSPNAWSKMPHMFDDREVKRLGEAATIKLEKRGRPYLFNEEDMIKVGLFIAIYLTENTVSILFVPYVL